MKYWLTRNKDHTDSFPVGTYCFWAGQKPEFNETKNAYIPSMSTVAMYSCTSPKLFNTLFPFMRLKKGECVEVEILLKKEIGNRKQTKIKRGEQK